MSADAEQPMVNEETTETSIAEDSGQSTASKLQAELGLAPRTIVLAKVKGYRAWPAMVLDENILPENIKKLKPKSVKQQKKTQPTILVPVRFFSDDTYIWIRNHDLKVLLDEEIQTFLDKHSTAGKKKDELLVFAYELAKDPPDMHQFNLWGSRGPPDFSDTVESVEEEDEPPRKKLKLKLNLKAAKTKTTSSKSKAPPKASAKKTLKSTPSKSKTKAAPTSKSKSKGSAKGSSTGKPKTERYASYEEFEKDLENDSVSDYGEFGSDWGLDDPKYNFDNGDFIFEDEQEQKKFVGEFPSASDLQATSAYYNEQFEKMFNKIAPSLLDGDLSNESQIIKDLRAAEKLAHQAPYIVFTKSLLYRCLVVAAHKSEEKLPSENVRQAIKNILESFLLETCSLTMEDLVLPTPQETPSQTPGLTPAPENGVKQEDTEMKEIVDRLESSQEVDTSGTTVATNTNGEVNGLDLDRINSGPN